MEKLEKFISTYENHPKHGVSFKDVIEIAQHPPIFQKVIKEMATSKIIKALFHDLPVNFHQWIKNRNFSFFSFKIFGHLKRYICFFQS